MNKTPSFLAGRARPAFAALAIALLCGSVQADPPGLAGRVSALQGSATLQQGADPAAPAALNWPVTSGDRIVTAPGARLELRVGATAVRLDGDTALDVDTLDDQRLALRIEHGRVALHAGPGTPVRALALATPQGRLAPEGAGRWRVESGVQAGLEADTTTVAAFDTTTLFAAGDDASLRATVAPGRELRISGRRAPSLLDTAIGAQSFDRWVAERDASDGPGRTAQYVSQEMTGSEELDRYGTWTLTDEYGPVWVPQGVAVDWAPYRAGRWAWVAPWGWTWIDAAPWGFAPFHYGRWALVGERWAWAPGLRTAAPVYAPALVGWIGGDGWSVSAATGPWVGWFPLAPFETYYPGFAVSTTYLRRLNAASVRDAAHLQARADVGALHYANRPLARAVTVVPAGTLAAGREVSRFAVPLHDARALAAWPTLARAPLELRARTMVSGPTMRAELHEAPPAPLARPDLPASRAPLRRLEPDEPQAMHEPPVLHEMARAHAREHEREREPEHGRGER